MTKLLFLLLLVAAIPGCDAGGPETASGRFNAHIEGGPTEVATGTAEFVLREEDGTTRIRAIYLTDVSDLRHRFVVHDGRTDLDGVGVYNVDWGPPEGFARIEYGVDTGAVLFGTDVKSGTLTITHFSRERFRGTFVGVLDLSPIDAASEARVDAEFDATPYAGD